MLRGPTMLRHLSLVFLLCLTAQASAARPTQAEIDRLVKQLGSDKFQLRQEASEALERIGEPAYDSLMKATQSEDAETRRRAAEVAKRVRGHIAARVLADIEKRGGRVYKEQDDPAEMGLHIDLFDGAFGEADLAPLRWLDDLRELRLNGDKFTDACLAHLRPLPGPQKLDLSHTAVTDAGLDHLRRCEKLECLLLNGTRSRTPAWPA